MEKDLFGFLIGQESTATAVLRIPKALNSHHRGHLCLSLTPNGERLNPRAYTDSCFLLGRLKKA